MLLVSIVCPYHRSGNTSMGYFCGVVVLCRCYLWMVENQECYPLTMIRNAMYMSCNLQRTGRVHHGTMGV